MTVPAAATHPAEPTAAEPASRRDRRTARTRQAILDAARELIDEHGFGHTTVDQIAERADIAPRTFFRYFASKEDVLFSHIAANRQVMLELIAARPADEHPLKAVVEGLSGFCALASDQRERSAWAFRIITENDLAYEQMMFKHETAERVAELISARLGVDPSADPRPRAWAAMVMTMFGQAMRCSLGAGRHEEPRPCFRALVSDTAAALAEVVGPAAR